MTVAGHTQRMITWNMTDRLLRVGKHYYLLLMIHMEIKYTVQRNLENFSEDYKITDKKKRAKKCLNALGGTGGIFITAGD